MMKNFLFLLLVLFMGSVAAFSHPLRYFEFKTSCGHGRWQDSSFIAATNDPIVIDSIEANLAKPIDYRWMINGKLGAGNAGYNHNASHWFNWHFIPNEWRLYEVSMEVCDGCPFTDVDTDTAYWIGIIKNFCPWTSKVLREVAAPAHVAETKTSSVVSLFPNPAKDKLTFVNAGEDKCVVTVYNTLFQPLSVFSFNGNRQNIDVSSYSNGTYYMKVQTTNGIIMKSFVVLH